ncbi:MAG: MaoC family dehydratase N-terminal domain-containing protein [Pseudomonadales bacterium]|nr:MaoC family dehydratase N-terminal domain-containing protein [Pseudomonadales bacterium]
MTNLYYEDISPGFRSSSRGYTLTEAEIIEFGQRWDPQPFHTDPLAAKNSVFGRLVAPGCYLFSVRSWLVDKLEDRPVFAAGLGLENMKLPNAAGAGDTLTLSVECTQRRESASRPDLGLVWMHNVIHNQHGQIVMELTAVMLVHKRKTGKD